MFTPPANRSMATSCSYKCALVVERAKTAERHEKDAKKVAKVINRERKENLKTLTEYLNDAQTEFNKYIRIRDKAAPCISCGTTNPCIQYAAGHFRTVAAASQLRFNEDNCHKQCNANCNKHKSGNITEYRINLVKKIGQYRVEQIESDNRLAVWTKEIAIEIKKEYRAKWKQLEKELDAVTL